MLQASGPKQPLECVCGGKAVYGGGGHPAMRPSSLQPEPGLEPWENRVSQCRLRPQTDPKECGPCQASQQALQHKHWAPGSVGRGHFSEVTSALKVLHFLPTSAQRAESPEPMSLEEQPPAPVPVAHHWPCLGEVAVMAAVRRPAHPEDRALLLQDRCPKRGDL